MSKFLDFLSSIKPKEADIFQTALSLVPQLTTTQNIPNIVSGVTPVLPVPVVRDLDSFYDDGESLIYPGDLFTPGNEAYVLFFMRESTVASAKILKRIAMYMPPSIRVNYGAKWEDINMAIFKATSEGETILNDIRSQGLVNGVKSADLGGAFKAAGIGGTGYLAASAFDKFTSDLNLPVYAAAGLAMNPHAALKFDSIDFRTFEFTFNLMARNREESETIRKIIKILKYGMHPSAQSLEIPSVNIPLSGGLATPTLSGKIFWNYPNVFDVYLATPSLRYMFNISRSVLEDVEVNYTGSDAATFFKGTGAPVHIELTLRFKETEVLTKERIKEDY